MLCVAAHPAMKVLLLLAAVMAVAEGDRTPPAATEGSRLGLQDGQSLLSTLLKATGYSDICVAAALDQCSSEAGDHFSSFMEEARGMVQQVSPLVNKWESRPRHCKDSLDLGDSGSGLRQVYPYPGRPHHRVTVYCDHTLDGGGWTVVQRRTNDTARQDFNRTWIEYMLGFGDLEGEFWLGNDLINELTSTTLQQLRVDLHDYSGGHRWAKYGFFHVGPPETNYRLSIGRYSGDAGDSMEYHNGHEFSTHDADHDKDSINCAKVRRGGWWYNACDTSNLNAYQHMGDSSGDEGIHWRHWLGDSYSLRRTSMMIRAAF